MSKAFLFAVSFMALFCSCDERRGLLPPSGGKLYEALLMGDSADIVKSALQADMPGLPQGEPQFDVSSIDSADFGSTLRTTREIVVVRTSPKLYATVRIRYDRDVWAEPQTVVTVTAPSMRMISDSIGRVAPTLLRLLNTAEMRKSLAMLRDHRNAKAERLVDSMFHVRMWVPLDMVSSRKDRDFVWLSNNSPSVMSNIVVYKAPRHGDPVAQRDSALARNIKGETDRMHIATVARTVAANPDGTVMRGLWEMTGDNMGGPFICRRVRTTEKDDNHDIVVEGFVFAPGKGKRDAMRQMETVLRSISATLRNRSPRGETSQDKASRGETSKTRKANRHN